MPQFVYITQYPNKSYSVRTQQNVDQFEKDTKQMVDLGYKMIQFFRIHNSKLLIPTMNACKRFTNGNLSLSELETQIKALSAEPSSD